MRSTITYSIFELAKDLKAAGINEAATDAIVKFEKAKDDAINDILVTKSDLKNSTTLLQRDIAWIKSIGGVGLGIIISLLIYLVQK